MYHFIFHFLSLSLSLTSSPSNLANLQFFGGTAVAQCTTNRKIAGSIPAGVIGIFHRHKTLPIALWPWGLREMSTRSISWG